KCINDTNAVACAIKPVTRFPTIFWIGIQTEMGFINT
ncbi:MAG: hypothetical protein ACI9C4_003237, partial [Paraglaciecola sp.]